MKITYTKGSILHTVSLLIALLALNFGAQARICTPPTVTATASDVTCHGMANGTVSLSVAGGTPGYTYSWTSSTGFTSTNQDITGLDSGSYTVTVTDASTCSATQMVTVSQPAALDVITSSNAPFCPGDTLNLYSSVSGGTATYAYSWSGPSAFTSTEQSPMIAPATAANNGVYTLTVTDAHNCVATNTFSVLLYPSPIVNLGPDAYICAAGNITLDAGNPGATFVWSTGANTQSITVSAVDTYFVTATNFYACSESDTIIVLASPYVVPTDHITATATSICAGVPVTFTANATNEGTNPTYVWRKNGLVVGTAGNTYTDASLANNDRITNRLTSSFPCASPATVYSDTIIMSVAANTAASVAITHTPDTACSGTPLTFTATSTGGGLTPYYEWLINGVVMGTGNIFIYSPMTSDSVTVRMASSLACHIPDTATAISGFTLYPHLVPTAFVTFTPNDTVSAIGAMTTFYCQETYGGTNPTYQWYVDRAAVPGATNSTYARHVYDNDTVRCVVVSTLLCAIPKRDTSNTVVIYATFLDVNGANAGEYSISVMPNPTNGDFTLTGMVAIKKDEELMVEVRDLKGSVVYRKSITSQKGKINESLSLNEQLAEGMYLLRISSDAGEKQLKLVIKK